MCRAELSGPRNINGTSASCFLSGVLVNVALVIALSFGLHQVQSFAVLFHGALVLFSAFAIIRPRPVFLLALFR